jgi:transmembrane sensor
MTMRDKDGPAVDIASVDFAGALRDVATEERLAAGWEAVRTRRDAARRGVPRAPLAMAAAAAALLAIGGAWLLRPDDAPRALTMADGAVLDGLLGPGVTDLSDASRIAVAEEGRLEVLESSADRVHLRLDEGRARFQVTPNGPRRWRIEAGIAAVEVVGTVFSVDRRDGGVRVEVERGIVLVQSEHLAEGVRRLTAGQIVEVARPTVAVAEPAAEETAPAPVVEGPGAEVEETPTPAPSAARPRPRRTETAATLLAAADAARVEGRYADAANRLEALLRRYPSDALAPLAAVTLGRLELQRLGRPGRAAASFERALALGLPHALTQEVEARHVEALARAGRTAEAREAAAAYERAHPSGRALDDVRRWAGAAD